MSTGRQRSGNRTLQGLAGLGTLAALTAVLAAAQAAPTPVEELIGRATRDGTVRVIVEVRPDAGTPPTPDAIRAAQDRVLQELAGVDHRVLRRYRTIPFLTLAASADALRRLAASPWVAGIREDLVRRPQGSTGSP